MRVKKGVDLDGLSTKMTQILHIVERVFAAYGQELTITAGLDGKHMTGSKHYVGEALDFRTWNVSDKQACVADLQAALGDVYDVVLEPTHIHIEYDPEV